MGTSQKAAASSRHCSEMVPITSGGCKKPQPWCLVCLCQHTRFQKIPKHWWDKVSHPTAAALPCPHLPPAAEAANLLSRGLPSQRSSRSLPHLQTFSTFALEVWQVVNRKHPCSTEMFNPYLKTKGDKLRLNYFLKWTNKQKTPWNLHQHKYRGFRHSWTLFYHCISSCGGRLLGAYVLACPLSSISLSHHQLSCWSTHCNEEQPPMSSHTPLTARRTHRPQSTSSQEQNTMFSLDLWQSCSHCIKTLGQALAKDILPLRAMHHWKADPTTTERCGGRCVLQTSSAQWWHNKAVATTKAVLYPLSSHAKLPQPLGTWVPLKEEGTRPAPTQLMAACARALGRGAGDCSHTCAVVVVPQA